MNVNLETYIDEETKQNKESNIEIIKEVGVGKNATKMVRLSSGKIGFLKNSANTTNAILDDLEYFMYIVGKHVFKFDFADVSKAYNGSDFIGTISENVAQDNEILMMFSTIISTLSTEPNEDIQIIAKKYQSLRNNNIRTFNKPNGETVDYPCLENEDEIYDGINMFSIVLDQLNISEENKNEIKEKYFQMLFFDLITGQKDRNNNNYGLLYNEETKRLRFSPLFDNSTIHLPGIPHNLCQINGFFADRRQMMDVLVNRFPEYTLPIVNNLIENNEEIIDKSSRVATEVLKPEQKEWIISTMKDGFQNLTEVTKKHSK